MNWIEDNVLKGSGAQKKFENLSYRLDKKTAT